MDQSVLSGFETIASGLYLEGLTVDEARGVIWYSDVIGGGIHGVRPDGGKVASFNQERMWTGGVLVNDDGLLLSTGQGGILWTDPDSGRSGWLLDEIDGQPVNGINEMVPDGAGGIYFGTNDIERVIQGEATRPTALYRLTSERNLIRVAEGIGFSNGLMHDAGRRRLYCNDTFHGCWAFDVVQDGSLAGKRMFLEKEDVDGMVLDAEGNAWITGFRSGFLTRLTPTGETLPRIDTPAGAITQVRFGGADMRTCYFNVVPADAGDTLKEGGSISTAHSFLYKARSSVPGMRIAPPRFRVGHGPES